MQEYVGLNNITMSKHDRLTSCFHDYELNTRSVQKKSPSRLSFVEIMELSWESGIGFIGPGKLVS